MIGLVGQWMAASGSSGSSGGDLLGGTDLLRLLVLALGGALVVGNGLALLRSHARSGAPRFPAGSREEEQVMPRPGRCMVMIAIGLIASVWAIASLAT